MNGNLGENEDLSLITSIERVMNQVTEVEEKGHKLFMPDFNPLQMHYRAELISILENRGWALKHWSVTGMSPFVCAYPVFVKETKP